MKKFLLVVGVIGVTNLLMASSTWTCYRYLSGEPTGGFVKISADSKQEAEQKAYDKYKELGYNFDSVNCK